MHNANLFDAKDRFTSAHWTGLALRGRLSPSMTAPHLTFFVERASAPLVELSDQPGVVDFLACGGGAMRSGGLCAPNHSSAGSIPSRRGA